MRVQMHAGYYDLATPYFASKYELNHLPIQATVRKNIEMHFYAAGHKIYATEPALQQLFCNVTAFIGGA
jgi:carboxypeptidase C (cathepsin A)